MAFLHQICWSSLTAKLIQEKLRRCHPMKFMAWTWPQGKCNFFLSSHKVLLANGQITQKQTKRIGRTFYQYSFSIFSTSSRPVNTWAALGLFICHAFPWWHQLFLSQVYFGSFFQFLLVALVFEGAPPPPSGRDVLVKLVTAADRSAIWEMHSQLTGQQNTGQQNTGLSTTLRWAFRLQCIVYSSTVLGTGHHFLASLEAQCLWDC